MTKKPMLLMIPGLSGIKDFVRGGPGSKQLKKSTPSIPPNPNHERSRWVQTLFPFPPLIIASSMSNLPFFSITERKEDEEEEESIPYQFQHSCSKFLFPMALPTFLPDSHQSHHKSSKRKKSLQQQSSSSSSWDQFKNLLTCKQIEPSKIHDPSRTSRKHPQTTTIYSTCGSICAFRDAVVHGGGARVVHRADISPESSSLGQETRLLGKKSRHGSSSSNYSRSVNNSGSGRSGASGAAYTGGGHRGMQLRKLSGCYECRSFVDPTRHPLARATLCACPECGEVFPKMESLEHHQAVRHAVSEMGTEDSSRNIVEIIFKSSWLKRDSPLCKIERILKVHNTRRTIQRFEDYRDAVKLRARRNARCAADGNELLRFHCATLTCSLGARGGSSLCSSVPACGVCTIIRHGFQGNKIAGVRTTASSGSAHDCLGGGGGGVRRAMLVCRVIAGRVKRAAGEEEEEEGGGESPAGGLPVPASSFDSVAGSTVGIYSDLEELYVFSSRAILPCFVVIYRAVEG